MGINLLRRKITTSKLPEYTKTQQAFYVVWHRGNDTEYFLCDMSLDGRAIKWSVFKESAVKFDNGEDALSLCREINKTNRGPGIIELKILDEQVPDEDAEMWVL